RGDRPPAATEVRVDRRRAVQRARGAGGELRPWGPRARPHERGVRPRGGDPGVRAATAQLAGRLRLTPTGRYGGGLSGGPDQAPPHRTRERASGGLLEDLLDPHSRDVEGDLDLVGHQPA